jgi:AcrR family transcriptional regulator
MSDDLSTRILDAAARIYAETGFRGTTTRRVAQEAGVNEVTLFRHFGTKEALVKAALGRVHQQMPPFVLGEPKDPGAEIYAWALGIYRHWFEGRKLICRVMGDLVEHREIAPGVCEEPQCEHGRLSAYLTTMRELGLTTREFHSDAAAGLLLGAIFTHAVWREHFEDETVPPAQVVIREYVRLLLSSIGATAEVPEILPEGV